MKYKSCSIPGRSKGLLIDEPSIVVPNQALTLRQILERFTRNQALPVGRTGSFDDGEDDLEKVGHMDPVDKAEFVEKLKKTQRDYDAQEKAKAKARSDALEKEERAKLAEQIRKEEKAALSAKTAE